MTVLTFKVSGGNLIRTDMNKLVSYTRNNAVAKFELNEEWATVSPVVAQFRKNDECCYDVFVENCMCAIPWEVLEGKGTLYVSVMGGDLITTNSVNISVIDTGIIGGLIPTTASPSVYKYIVEMAEKIQADYGEMEEFVDNIDSFVEECTNKVNDVTKKGIEAVEEKAEELITFEPITEEEIDGMFK